MDYHELHQRYGSHVAKRVQAELGMSEFSLVDLKSLSSYLEKRADISRKEYQLQLTNPIGKQETDIDFLHRRWRDAEELAYLVSVTEDIGVNFSGHFLASAK